MAVNALNAVALQRDLRAWRPHEGGRSGGWNGLIFPGEAGLVAARTETRDDAYDASL